MGTPHQQHTLKTRQCVTLKEDNTSPFLPSARQLSKSHRIWKKGSNFSRQTNMVCLRSYSKNAGKVSQNVGPTHTSLLIVKCCSSNKTWRNPGTEGWRQDYFRDLLGEMRTWLSWFPMGSTWDFRDARKEYLSFHRPNRDFSLIELSTQQTAPDSGADQLSGAPTYKRR
jgi:hypothetical protein